MVLNDQSLVEKYFEIICGIPHISKQEKALSDYIVSEAKKLGYEYIQDELYNVIVKIPATPGNNQEPIMISGHMDMVPNKTSDKVFDFNKDPIELVLKDGILKADRTTLGADDGVATAYMLALMHDDFDHPLIECVFTVQEEIGCNGSRFIDTSSLVSKRLIGLDTTGEHEVTVGNYCSDLVKMHKTYNYVPTTKQGYKVRLKDINAQHVGDHVLDLEENGIQYLMMILDTKDCQIVSINGGVAENFPPNTCEAIVVSDEKIMHEMLEVETIEVNECLSQEDTDHLFELILSIPNGAYEYDEVLLSSFLLGKITTDHHMIEILGSTRSRNDDYNEHIADELKKLCFNHHYEIEMSVRYRSWKYEPYSKLREAYRTIIKEELNQDLVETICPGGLEISDFLYKIPGLDVLSIGPKAGGFHTPDEWLDVNSFNKMFGILKKLIVFKN